jgi:hypothetical protein
MIVTLLFISLEKEKRAPHLKIIVFCFGGKNSHYTITKKYPNHFSPINFAMTKLSYEKDISISNCRLNQIIFFEKSKIIFTLF